MGEVRSSHSPILPLTHSFPLSLRRQLPRSQGTGGVEELLSGVGVLLRAGAAADPLHQPARQVAVLRIETGSGECNRELLVRFFQRGGRRLRLRRPSAGSGGPGRWPPAGVDSAGASVTTGADGAGWANIS